MKLKEIEENLCYYDERNPDSPMDKNEIKDHKENLKKTGGNCYCDNCFNGRTKIAEQLWKYVPF